MFQSLWQIGKPMRRVFFFFRPSSSSSSSSPPPFFLITSRSIKFESITTFVHCKNLIVDWTRCKTKTYQKSVVQCVLLCLSYLFTYISEEKKKEKFECCWMKRAPKNKCAHSFETIDFCVCVFSLIRGNNLQNLFTLGRFRTKAWLGTLAWCNFWSRRSVCR